MFRRAQAGRGRLAAFMRSAIIALGAMAWPDGPQALAFKQAPTALLERPGAEPFLDEALSPFEQALSARIGRDGWLLQDAIRGPAERNARGVAITHDSAALIGLSVWRRKYGVSLDDTGDILIKNYSFTYRHSMDAFGSGLLIGQKSPTRGEVWLSNAYIDLKEAGPDPDYLAANNEAVTVERESKAVNIRRAVLVGAQESGLDNKGEVRMDAAFIASGHRSLRVWSGASLTLANSIVLAFPGYHGVWFGGGGGLARLSYYNCRFGRVGDSADQLVDVIPEWMIDRARDGVDVRIERLDADPFDRTPSSFWRPAAAPHPLDVARYLAGSQ